MIKKTLVQLYKEHGGKVSDRWSSYLYQYERILREYRDSPIRLLEIGIQNGGSLELWAKYFSNAKKLVGCDINPDCVRLRYEDERVRAVVADANSDEAQAAILGSSPFFDIIIDDGSHRSSDIARSFCRYFPYLVDGGVFIAEDLHCSYWEEFEGGLFHPFSSIAFFKRLADIINQEHWGNGKSRSALLAGFCSEYGLKIDEVELEHIQSVEFLNSICVVRKVQPTHTGLGTRFIAGRIEDVVPSHIGILEGTTSEPQNQAANQWSARELPPDEELPLRINQLAERDQQLARANHRLRGLMQQQSTLQAELLALHTERRTFGARLGRRITRSLSCIAPVGTRRRSYAKLLERFASTLITSGMKAAVSKAHRYISARTQSPLVPSSDHQEQLKAYFNTEPSAEQLDAQRREAKIFRCTPLLSVILPVYRVPQQVLNETLASLERQTYSHWEACIVWADSEDKDGWEWLQRRTASDQRFKIKLLSKNGGISINSNAALELASGEFIALLDHDDTLSPWAFWHVVKYLQDRPALDFIYSDKDSITADGEVRLNALFKPEWSPEMLHSVNYLTHLNVIRTEIVRKIGGWRPETDGAQDWDLFFRVTEKTKNIARIPSILYHWRILPTSTATGLQAKPYAALGQLKSQQDHFSRRCLPASVMPTTEGLFKVCWPKEPACVDVVVFQSGSAAELNAVLSDLISSADASVRRIYAVHSAPISSIEIASDAKQKDVFFVAVENANWRASLDAVLSDEVPDTVLILDGRVAKISETLVSELCGWIFHHPEIAWVSAIALTEDEFVCEAGRVVSDDFMLSAPLLTGVPLNSFGWFGGPLWYRNASACSPYAVAMKAESAREALYRLDASKRDPLNFTLFCREIVRADQRGLINPFARIYFNEQPELNWPNDGAQFHRDPYFNPVFQQVSPLRLQK